MSTRLFLKTLPLDFWYSEWYLRGIQSPAMNRKTNGDSQMLIDLASLSVLPQQPSQDSLSSHPKHLRWHPSLTRTLSLTRTSVSSLALRRQQSPSASTRVYGRGFDDDPSVLDQFLDVCAGVGITDFCLLSGVQPDLAFAYAGDGCGEPLLRFQGNHGWRVDVSCDSKK